jgi:hypothetical protein
MYFFTQKSLLRIIKTFIQYAELHIVTGLRVELLENLRSISCRQKHFFLCRFHKDSELTQPTGWAILPGWSRETGMKHVPLVSMLRMRGKFLNNGFPYVFMVCFQT